MRALSWWPKPDFCISGFALCLVWLAVTVFMESLVPPAFCPLGFWYTLELGQGEAGRGSGMSLWMPWRAWLCCPGFSLPFLNPHTFLAANRFWNESDLPWHSLLAQIHCECLAYLSHYPEPEPFQSPNWDNSNYPFIYWFNVFSTSPLFAMK